MFKNNCDIRKQREKTFKSWISILLYSFIYLKRILSIFFSWLSCFKFRFVKRSFASICLCFITIAAIAQLGIIKPNNWQSSFSLGYKTGSMNGFSLGTDLTLNKRIAIELKLSKAFFTEYEFNIPLYLNNGKNQLYIQPGYGYFKKGNSPSYELKINSLNFSLGYKSEFYNKFYVDTRISMVKYLNESYKSIEISSFEKYNPNEKIFFEISLSVGFLFCCD